MKLQPVSIPARPRGLKFEISALADPRFEVHAEAGVVDLFDSITPETPAQIAAALRQLGGRPITLRLNSLGGDPFSGMTAFNLLAGYSATVTVEILGIAASAASLVAMGGDQIRIAGGAQVMIHRASAGMLGNGDDMRAMAEALDRVDAALGSIYQARTGLPSAQIVDLMSRDTFLSAGEALALGFADSLLENSAGIAPPRLAATAAPSSKRDLEESFRGLGFSRAAAARMTAAAWPAARQSGDPDPESELDLTVIADVIARNVAAFTPRQR